MYLTDKFNGVPRSPKDHEELEVLLESFSKQVEEIVNETENISVSSPPSSCMPHNATEMNTGQRAINTRDCRTYS